MTFSDSSTSVERLMPLEVRTYSVLQTAQVTLLLLARADK